MGHLGGIDKGRQGGLKLHQEDSSLLDVSLCRLDIVDREVGVGAGGHNDLVFCLIIHSNQGHATGHAGCCLDIAGIHPLGLEELERSLAEYVITQARYKYRIASQTSGSYCLIGTFVGALPGAGGPVASFLAYGQAKRIVKHPSRPFGEGAVEGIVASESANNACIGGALIPMLTLAIPGDAVTAIILSVFYIHGLQPGPTFLKTGRVHFYEILAGGLIACVFLLLLGLLVAPRISKVINVPKRILLPIVVVLCVIGAYACNRRVFDVELMFFFGIVGFILRRRGFPTAPVTLGLVLGGMMDSNFRRAVSLASTTPNPLVSMFGRPITIILLVLTIAAILGQTPAGKKLFRKE